MVAAGRIIAEDVRMATLHLVANAVQYLVEREVAGFGRHLRVEDDLQRKIAEFVLEVREIAALDRVGDFIGFLDRVRRDRLERLLTVPRTAVHGVAEPAHDLNQIREIPV